MRRLLSAGLCLLFLGATTACAQAVSAPATPTPDRRAILIAVLRRYLTTPAENSFSDRFVNVYVLDRTGSDVAGTGSAPPGRPISTTDQAAIVAALRDIAPTRFVADGDEVVVTIDGCAQVRDGILVTLGEPAGDGDRVEVSVEGFVACLGATWLTYVVRWDGVGWGVTGTTGSIAVA
jgi:hypothetical protein